MNRIQLISKTSLALVVTTLLSLGVAGKVQAQSFSIEWFSIDCGGGTVSGTDSGTGTAFALSSTIGQHDAGGPMTGTSSGGTTFALTGGFWAGGQAPLPPTCPADINGDGELNPDDLADFINCYFSSPPCPESEFNDDGETNPDDLADYINAYFAGCA